MAEAFARRHFVKKVKVESAGIRPQPPEDAREAIDTLKSFGLSMEGHVPRDVRSLDLASFDLVVAMDKSVARELKALTQREVIIWRIDDPWGDDPAQYLRCARTIQHHVAKLAEQLRTGS
jgi:protein-tyrosine-phosphatase